MRKVAASWRKARMLLLKVTGMESDSPAAFSHRGVMGAANTYASETASTENVDSVLPGVWVV